MEAAEATTTLLRVARAAAQVDLRGGLLDSAGSVVASHDDSFLEGAERAQFFLPVTLEAGVHYLRVGGSLGGDIAVCDLDPRATSPSDRGLCPSRVQKPANTGAGPYTVAANVIPSAGSDFAGRGPFPSARTR